MFSEEGFALMCFSTVQVKDCIEHTITGRMCVIWPVSSNTITDVEMVCVTAADMAAAPVYHKTKKVNTYNYDLAPLLTKSWCIKGINEKLPKVSSSLSFMHVI